jgi:hypothetical protein
LFLRRRSCQVEWQYDVDLVMLSALHIDDPSDLALLRDAFASVTLVSAPRRNRGGDRSDLGGGGDGGGGDGDGGDGDGGDGDGGNDGGGVGGGASGGISDGVDTRRSTFDVLRVSRAGLPHPALRLCLGDEIIVEAAPTTDAAADAPTTDDAASTSTTSNEPLKASRGPTPLLSTAQTLAQPWGGKGAFDVERALKFLQPLQPNEVGSVDMQGRPAAVAAAVADAATHPMPPPPLPSSSAELGSERWLVRVRRRLAPPLGKADLSRAMVAALDEWDRRCALLVQGQMATCGKRITFSVNHSGGGGWWRPIIRRRYH